MENSQPCRELRRISGILFLGGVRVSSGIYFRLTFFSAKELESNRVTLYSYDNMNRLTKISIPDGWARSSCPKSGDAEHLEGQGKYALVASRGDRATSETFLTYSSLGRLLSVSDENGKIEFTYDSFGRVTSETGEVGVIKYEYNSRGLLSAKECMFSHGGT
jgi:YD repeat-containing protein